jgi:hypothetical protein
LSFWRWNGVTPIGCCSIRGSQRVKRDGRDRLERLARIMVVYAWIGDAAADSAGLMMMGLDDWTGTRCPAHEDQSRGYRLHSRRQSPDYRDFPICCESVARGFSR